MKNTFPETGRKGLFFGEKFFFRQYFGRLAEIILFCKIFKKNFVLSVDKRVRILYNNGELQKGETH